MSYKKPDVYVSLEFEAASVTAQDPSLFPIIMGEHYFVKNKADTGKEYDGAELVLSYPDLPKQTVDTASDLIVDIVEEDYSPNVYVLTNTGVRVDVTAEAAITSSQVTIPASLKYNATTGKVAATGDDLSGKVLISYRALEEKYTGSSLTLLSAASMTDLTNLFGSDGMGPANPLGYGMYLALMTGQKTVLGVAVGNPASEDGSSTYTGAITDEVKAYSASADFMKSQEAYLYVPLTFDKFVHQVILSHVDYMSGSDGKSERRMIGVDPMPGKDIYRKGDTGNIFMRFNSDSVNFSDGDTVTIAGTDYTVTVFGGQDSFVEVQGISEAASNIAFTYNGTDYSDGQYIFDKFMFKDANQNPFTNAGYYTVKTSDGLLYDSNTYDIVAVKANAIEVTGAGGTSGVPASWNLYRFFTIDGTADGQPDKQKEAERLADLASSIDNEREMLLAPGYVGTSLNGEVVDVPAYFYAAALAGEIAATDAGAPVGVNANALFIESKSTPFKSVRYFSEAQLNTIAGGGVAIIMNTVPGAGLMLRHTLTTDRSTTEKGEFILGVARDYTARTYRNTLRTLIRKYRVSPKFFAIFPLYIEAVRSDILGNDVMTKIVHKDIQTVEGQPDAVAFTIEVTQNYPVNYIYPTITVVQPTVITINV